MMPAPAFLTVDEYLDGERRAPNKHELRRGVVVAMAGASRQHVRITTDLTVAVGLMLRGSGCSPFSSDMRVATGLDQLYTYPDLSIVCGEPQYRDAQVDTLLNPVAIFEVLSSSTEAYDRGAKFAHYQTVDSLLTYVLVSTESPHVDVFTRQASGAWLLEPYAGLEAVARLNHPAIDLALAEIYAGVSWPPAATPVPEPGTP